MTVGYGDRVTGVTGVTVTVHLIAGVTVTGVTVTVHLIAGVTVTVHLGLR